MTKRCIMIFPCFSNMGIIDNLRNKYDPLSKLVRPHITLVFPFESEIPSNELEEHIKSAGSTINPFQLTMRGITGSIEPWGNYLFLNVSTGIQEVYSLSKNLYTGILAIYKSKIYEESYCPHMTVGRLSKDENFDEVLNMVKDEREEFITVVSSIGVEVIGEDESSTIEMMIQL